MYKDDINNISALSEYSPKKTDKTKALIIEYKLSYIVSITL